MTHNKDMHFIRTDATGTVLGKYGVGYDTTLYTDDHRYVGDSLHVQQSLFAEPASELPLYDPVSDVIIPKSGPNSQNSQIAGFNKTTQENVFVLNGGVRNTLNHIVRRALCLCGLNLICSVMWEAGQVVNQATYAPGLGTFNSLMATYFIAHPGSSSTVIADITATTAHGISLVSEVDKFGYQPIFRNATLESFNSATGAPVAVFEFGALVGGSQIHITGDVLAIMNTPGGGTFPPVTAADYRDVAGRMDFASSIDILTGSSDVPMSTDPSGGTDFTTLHAFLGLSDNQVIIFQFYNFLHSIADPAFSTDPHPERHALVSSAGGNITAVSISDYNQNPVDWSLAPTTPATVTSGSIELGRFAQWLFVVATFTNFDWDTLNPSPWDASAAYTDETLVCLLPSIDPTTWQSGVPTVVAFRGSTDMGGEWSAGLFEMVGATSASFTNAIVTGGYMTFIAMWNDGSDHSYMYQLAMQDGSSSAASLLQTIGTITGAFSLIATAVGFFYALPDGVHQLI